MSRTRGWLAGFLVGGFFLFLALRQVDLRQVGKILLDADPWLLLAAFALVIANYVARGYRWAYILRPAASLSARQVTPFVMFGTAVNYVVPGRVGEFARAYALGGLHHISKTLSLGTVVLERAFDTAVLLLFFVAAVLLGRSGQAQLDRALEVGALVVLLALGLALVVRFSRLLLSLVDGVLRPRWPGLAPKVGGLLQALLTGLSCASTLPRLSWLTLLSIGAWLITVLQTWLVYQALGATSLPMYSTMMLMGATAMSMLVPNAPGNLGTSQWVAISVLGLFGAASDVAISISLVLQAMDMIFALGGMLFFLRSPAFSLSRVRAGSLEAGQATP